MNEPQAIDYRRKWHALAAVGSGVFLATVDGSIVNVSLPTLVRDLDTQFAIVQWVVLSYLLTVSTTMIGIGRLADMVGKKTIYTTGFVIFTIGSALCGTALSVYWLIAFRILQAIGSAMILALGAAILTEAFPPEERGRAMGWIGSIVSMGIVVGPVLGGIILGTLSWRWIFLVNLPVGAIGIFMVRRNVPDYKPKGRQRFDFLGAAALFLCLLSLLLGLTFGQQKGFDHFAVLTMMGLSVALLAVFIRLEQKVAQPMINLKMFRSPFFSISLITGFISFVGLAGVFILMPFYLENILGFKAVQVGLLMGIIPVMLGLTSPFAGAMSDRLGTRRLAAVGLACMFLGYLAASTLSQETTALGYMLRMLALGAGIGIFISPNNSGIMGTARRHELGVISGLMAITRTLGQTVGVAVMGAVWAGRTASYVGRQHPAGATAAPADAQVAGLNDTFETAAVLLAFALVLGLWAYVKEARGKRSAPPGKPLP